MILMSSKLDTVTAAKNHSPQAGTIMTTQAIGRENLFLTVLKKHGRILGLAAAFILTAASAHAQGCVIARGGGASAISDSSGYLEAKSWQLNFAFRHFKSDRHFISTDEQPQRQEQGTEVINDSYFYDVTATYAWSKRLSFSVTMPFVNHDRSSKYEHSGNSGARYHTQASGYGDLRLSTNYWIMNPDTPRRWNVSVGVGLKLPTGDFEARDIFYRTTGPAERYVDSSIQPGDGGVGATVELQGFFHIVGGLSAYANGFYLFNPEERVETTGFSIPDGYMIRGGLDYRVDAIKGLSVSLGLRDEGVPGHDAFGGNRGSRRPGFSVAVEPGITYAKGRYSATLTVPVAVHRRRTTTFGSARPGDAAFADYSVNLGLSMKL